MRSATTVSARLPGVSPICWASRRPCFANCCACLSCTCLNIPIRPQDSMDIWPPAIGYQVRIGSHAVNGTTSLYLRPPSPLDPPILIVLSLLLDEFFSHKHRIPPLALTAPPLAVHAQG